MYGKSFYDLYQSKIEDIKSDETNYTEPQNIEEINETIVSETNTGNSAPVEIEHAPNKNPTPFFEPAASTPLPSTKAQHSLIHSKIDDCKRVSDAFQLVCSEIDKNIIEGSEKNIERNVSQKSDVVNESPNTVETTNSVSSKTTISTSKTHHKFICTLCKTNIINLPCEHPTLKVLLCGKCEKRVCKTRIGLIGVDINDYCSWCFYGGNLVCCDYCDKSFCNTCISRNFGDDYFSKAVLQLDKWTCFSCDPKPLNLFKEKCRVALAASIKSFEREVENSLQSKKRHCIWPHTEKSKIKKIIEPESSGISDSSSSSNEGLPIIVPNSESAVPIQPASDESSDSSIEPNVFIPLGKNISKKKYLAERAKRQLANPNPVNLPLDSIVVLEKDDKGQSIVSVSPYISKNLKPHQIDGVRFMYENTIVIALLDSLLTYCGLKTVLILCPLSACDHWANEFVDWLPQNKTVVYRIHDPALLRTDRKSVIENWFDSGGVLIISYSLYRSLFYASSKNSETYKNSIKYTLQNPGPDIIICDEGHLIKNIKSQISEVLKNIKTGRRIVLTGTPLQNNLMEYYCMVNFVRPGFLSTPKKFSQRFRIPIENGQLGEANALSVSAMKKRCHVLHRLLKPIVQRKDHNVLLPYLKPKYEYTIFIRSSEMQVKLFNHVVDVELNQSKSSFSFNSLFKLFETFLLIGLHPAALSIREDRLANNLDDDFYKMDNTENGKATKEKLALDDIPVVDGHTSQIINVIKNTTRWYEKYFSEAHDMSNLTLSGKLYVLNTIIEDSLKHHQKIVIFSQSLVCLDLISRYFVTGIMYPPDSKSKYWVENKNFYRIDGSTSLSQRSNYITLFNDKKKTDVKVIVIDKKPTERVFSTFDLMDLFKVSPSLLISNYNNKSIPSWAELKKFPGLGEVIQKCYPVYIVRYIEHNSLLLDDPNQQLSEQEQDQAMDEYLYEANTDKIVHKSHANGAKVLLYYQKEKLDIF
ncbi:hypothetical protein MXB_2071 [Myxobolus squamalis]|nr:hypothetical protein MXB_2071 [Myxobolus squamalis]